MWTTLWIGLLLVSPADLKMVRVDSDAEEAFLSVRADSMGRLFVGTRDVLYVYEPDKLGGYQPRRRLYRFPAQSNIVDAEFYGDDLYVLTQTALHVIPGGVRKRVNLQPRKLIWGVPKGTTGFRALARGPEGDLYFSVGDPLADSDDMRGYWTLFSQPAGAKTACHGGGLFRCKPDGTGLQLVAAGGRDPSGICFDRHWNLITKACCYDDTHLPERYRNQALFQDKTRPPPTSIRVGRGGRIFATFTERGKSELVMLTRADDPDTHPFAPYEAADATTDKLWQELKDPSGQRRHRAHAELIRRGGDLLRDANKRLLTIKASDADIHCLIWLAAKSQRGSLHLFALVDNVDPLVRAQALRALAEFPEQLRDEPIFAKALIDKQPDVQRAAVLAYLSPKIAWSQAVQQAIERGPACSEDDRLRRAAGQVLAAKLTAKQLESLCARSDAPSRLAGVLAIGLRLTAPPVMPAVRLRDESVCVVEYVDETVDLRKLGRVGTYKLAENWRPSSAENERLLGVLRQMAKDRDERVRMQAADFVKQLSAP